MMDSKSWVKPLLPDDIVMAARPTKKLYDCTNDNIGASQKVMAANCPGCKVIAAPRNAPIVMAAKKKLYECKKDVGRAANSACAKNTAGKYNIMLKLQRKHLKRRFPNTLNYVCFFKWVCYWRFFSTINTISFNKHAKHHWRVLWAHRRRKRRSAARSRQVHLGVQAALTWMVDIN